LKICVIYPGSLYSAWSVSDGIPRTLTAMGHEVLDFAQGRTGKANWWDRLDAINKADLVIMSGPEHFCKNPGLEQFKQAIKFITVPKFGVYHESMLRADQNFPFPELLDSFDHHFYPAIQDAEALSNRAKDRCTWLPFGVDTTVFEPWACPHCHGSGGKKAMITGPAGKMAGTELCPICHGACIDITLKTIPFGFIGLMYGKRKVFMDKVAQVYDLPVELICGNVVIQDIEGLNPFMTARRLAWNYNRMMCFVNLPSLSQLMVTKVTEVMACGVCLLTPRLEGQGVRNMKGFDHGKNILFYRDDPKDLVAVMRGVMKNPEMAQQIGKEAAKSIREHHSLKDRMEELLSKFAKPSLVEVKQ